MGDSIAFGGRGYRRQIRRVAPPIVVLVTPSNGTSAGSTAVTISGSGFVNGATVAFDTTPATSVVWNSPSNITCVTAARAYGYVSVTVTNPDRQFGTKLLGYLYDQPPAVFSVSPTTGFAIGTTPVTITGAAFVNGATVLFGGVLATSIVWNSSTSIACVSPAGTGTVTVTVTNPDAQVGTLAAAFTYNPAPTVSSVSPAFGTAAGSTSITVTGTEFDDGASVMIGGTPATNVVWNSSTSITCLTAPKAFGQYNIVVTNPDTQLATLASAFSHFKELDFSSMAAGSHVNATFLSATGLTAFTRPDTTVTTNSCTVQTSASTLQSGIALNLPRIYFDGSNRGFLIEHAVNNQFVGNVRNGVTGWTASGQGTQTISSATGPDGTGLAATRLSMSAVNNISNYRDLGAESAFLFCFSTWQKSASSALTDMQQCIQNNTPGTGNTTVRAGSLSWGRLVTQKTATQRRYFWACDTYDRTASGQNGQSARGRDVHCDFYQLEYGDFATSAISTATSTRDQDRATWTIPFSGSRLRFYASFKPILISASSSFRTDGAAHTAWPIYTFDGQNDVTVNISTKILTIKSNNISWTSATPLAWALYDNVEVMMNYGNNVASTASWRVNSGSWTGLSFGTVTGSAVPPTTTLSLFTGLTSDQNTLPCIIQKVRSYPIDVTTANL